MTLITEACNYGRDVSDIVEALRGWAPQAPPADVRAQIEQGWQKSRRQPVRQSTLAVSQEPPEATSPGADFMERCRQRGGLPDTLPPEDRGTAQAEVREAWRAPFAQVYEEKYAGLHRFSPETQDAVQEGVRIAYERVWRVQKASMKGYIEGCIKWTQAKEQRKEVRRAARLPAYTSGGGGTAWLYDEETAQQEREEWVQQGLTQLPRELRAQLEAHGGLHDAPPVSGYKLAEQQGYSKSAAYRRIRKAKEALRRILTNAIS